jgi:peptidyl-prolyl cis-trans isomerase C
MPKGKGVHVNGVVIPRDAIAREMQQHPSKAPVEAWRAAARALVVRELLLQEARRLDVSGEPLADAEGRRETEDEAALRALIAREVRTPTPDAESCRRCYEQNLRCFRSLDIFEAAHILFSAAKADTERYARARAEAMATSEILRERPDRFEELARAHSACPSAAQGGNLGQISPGQVTPEFERALAQLMPGAITPAPIETRYGFHIIRLDRRIGGRLQPFDMVAGRIAEFLRESVERRAIAQYIARLVSRAEIAGIDLANSEALRTN